MSDVSTASSTTRWARCGCPAHAKWQAQTQRAVENFPISGSAIERALIRALAPIKGAAATVNARLKVLDKERRPTPSHEAGRRGGRGPVGRPVPRRRVPDRVGHLVEHEHERGAGHLGRPSGSATGPPQRSRQRLAVVERRVPVGDPRRRDERDRQRARSRPSTTSPRRCAARAGSSSRWSSRAAPT